MPRAYEGLARVWRDWGLPSSRSGDAQRATFYAPQSASARNTYGTVMQALGRYADATAAYQLAIAARSERRPMRSTICVICLRQRPD